MRLAVISDIHGNVAALEAALDDIARRGITNIICLAPRRGLRSTSRFWSISAAWRAGISR